MNLEDKNKKAPRLVLGSASPRRALILSRLHPVFTVVAPQAEEKSNHADPVATVIDNARLKHAVVRALQPDAYLVTADTLVFLAGRVIGKPRDDEHARAMLRALSGRVHTVFTAVVMSCPRGAEDTRVEASSVRFRPLSDDMIGDYLRAVKPLDRAGAYDIDEQGERLVAECRGSRTNVMGLPAASVADWLRVNFFPALARGDD